MTEPKKLASPRRVGTQPKTSNAGIKLSSVSVRNGNPTDASGEACQCDGLFHEHPFPDFLCGRRRPVASVSLVIKMALSIEPCRPAFPTGQDWQMMAIMSVMVHYLQVEVAHEAACYSHTSRRHNLLWPSSSDLILTCFMFSLSDRSSNCSGYVNSLSTSRKNFITLLVV